MNYVLDTHTHTLASGHAYCTMNEMILAAEKKGLEALAITEHSMRMPGTCHLFHFQNLRIIDRHAYNVELMLGTELNIIDNDGTVDMPEETLAMMDICIASMHVPCYAPRTPKEHLNAYIKAMKNPYVDIIGHPDDARFEMDYDAFVYAAKENNVLLEVNASSLSPTSFRLGARDNYINMLALCKQYKVPVVCGSDAHVDYLVGNHEDVYQLFDEISFPEELVVNRSVTELKKYLHRYKNL